MIERCPHCYTRIRLGETLIGHEFSGRCSAHQVFSESELAKADRRRAANPHPTRTGRTINREEPEHGSRSRYQSPKWKCRCDLCTEAESAYHKVRKVANPEYAARQKAARRAWKQRQREKVG